MLRRLAPIVLASALVIGGAEAASAAVGGPGDAGVPFWVDVSYLNLVSESGTAVGTYQSTVSLFRGSTRVGLGSFSTVQVDDINATGTSTGRVDYRAVTWTPSGSVTTIPNLPDATATEGVDINDSGDVLVQTFQGRPFSNGAAVWHAGVLTPLRHGADLLVAKAINGSGQSVVLTDNPDQDAPTALRCSLAGTCAALPLPPGARLATFAGVNDAGTVVGTAIVDGVARAVAWNAADQFTVLPLLPGTTASGVALARHAVNARGDIIGYSDNTAVVWRSGAPTALPGGRALVITDQNNRGDVVGSSQGPNGDPRPFVISRGTSFAEVGTLFLLPRGQVSAISDKGLAVGTSWFSYSLYPGVGVGNQRATTWQVS